MDIFLVHPPVAKPCEPPPGIARLAGTLNEYNCSCLVLDANIEGLLFLASTTDTSGDTWTRRAGKHLEANLASLRNGTAFKNTDRYRCAVTEINRILAVGSGSTSTRVTLSNYSQTTLSPVKSADLLYAAQHPEINVFYPYFKRRFSSLLEKHVPGIWPYHAI